MNTDRLKELRKQKGITQREMSSILGYSRQRYNFYETGKREPDNDTIVKLANFFNVSADYLLDMTDDPTPLDEKKAPSNNVEGDIRNRIISIVEELPEEAMPHVLKIVRAYIPDDEELT